MRPAFLLIGWWLVAALPAQTQFQDRSAGAFTDSPQRLPPEVPPSSVIVTIDVDGDQDQDVLFPTVTRLLINMHRQLNTTRLAISGRPFALRFDARPGYGTADHTALAWIGAPRDVPATIPGLGTLWLDLSTAVALPPVQILAATGSATQSFQIPAAPSLIGAVFYTQALMLASDTGLIRLTGHTAERVLR
ncbi:MAG: hypothetical protein AAF628_24665 [Planctomycetota bacterium]